MEKDMPIPKQEDLHGIAMLAEEQVKLTKELAELENQLNKKKAELLQITEVALPESMLQIGMKSFVLDDGSKNQEEVMIQSQVHSDLKLLIEQLPEDQMEVLKLRYFEDMSFKKISDLTGVSINTALGRMRYALINLRKLAVQQNIDLQLK